METRTYKVYKFDELTPAQQNKAINNYADINLDYKWWDYIYEDAKTVGIQIEGCDLYRYSIEGRLIDSVMGCIDNIKKEHGKICATYKTAKRYEKEAKRLFQLQDYTDEEYDASEKLNADFKADILKDYFKMLQEEVAYKESREAIIETFKANDYNFTENGKLD